MGLIACGEPGDSVDGEGVLLEQEARGSKKKPPRSDGGTSVPDAGTTTPDAGGPADPGDTGSAPAPVGVPGAWTLSWSDEFTQPGLDATRWTTHEPWHSGGWSADDAYYPVPAGDLVESVDGVLNLRARRRTNPAGKPMVSGMVTSRAKFDAFTHGYTPEDEHWEFPPDTVVRCAIRRLEGDDALVAVEAVSFKPTN